MPMKDYLYMMYVAGVVRVVGKISTYYRDIEQT